MVTKARRMSNNVGDSGDAASATANESGIAAPGTSTTSAGSLPVQMPGRSYYKYRSNASSNQPKDGMPATSMSLTQSSIDIREGSARLASLGLAEFGDEVYPPSEDEEEGAVSEANDRRQLSFRRQGIQEVLQEGEGLLLSSTSKQHTPINLSGPNTPSGISVLLSKHEGKASTPSSSSSGSASDETTKQRFLTSTPNQQGKAVSTASSLAGSAASTPARSSGSSSATVGESTPLARSPSKLLEVGSEEPSIQNTNEASSLQPKISLGESLSERSPLLRHAKSTQSMRSYTTQPSDSPSKSTKIKQQQQQRQQDKSAKRSWQAYIHAQKNALWKSTAQSTQTLKKTSFKDMAISCVVEPAKTLPAVVLGILMNLLDGVSYGMIMFPVSSPVFSAFGGIGVSMFFSSCFVSQMVFSSRSIFKGGNGSMMIEVVPFLHVIAFTISDRMGGMENQHAVIATTMVAYALTSILTGLVFFLLGYLRLGAFIEFFPRVVLVGCIGGVGAFLVLTGVQVCAGLENETLHFTWDVIQRFFEWHMFLLWAIPLVLAIVIRIITSSRFDHPLVFPAFMLAIPVVFYIVVFVAQIPISTLRDQGWIFNMAGVDTPFYEYFTLYDFKATSFSAVIETIPTQLALVFFALLHVPINVPALALSVGEDNVQTDAELVNHGLSNFLAGCVGSIPNYLVYTNSVLFYRVGGTNRLSGFMLALVTLLVFLVGPWVIGYLPVMIVGTLIYILGYDLLKEAVWDTWGRVSGFDYSTIWIIILAMTYFDFVVGIGVGIVVACVSFVIVSSQRQPIRATMSGNTASSTVRRHPRQSAFLRKVGTQTRIIKLQSFLFFGTVVKVESKIRDMLDIANWNLQPIRFLILDFSLASGVDFSAAEAFLRIQRLLQVKNVILVLCGCDSETAVGKALNNVDLFQHNDDLVRVFSTLNDALEHCENSQLRSLYSKTLDPIMSQQQDASRMGVDISYRLAAAEGPASAVENFSPRRTHLYNAANETFAHHRRRSIAAEGGVQAPPTPSRPSQIANGPNTPSKAHFAEPLRLLMQSLGPYAPGLKEDFWHRLTPYFHKLKIAKGDSLWSIGDTADAMYVLETGILRAIYDFPDSAQTVYESMLPGTIAGEMTFLAGSKRNTTVVAERDCELWRMNDVQLGEFEEKEGSKIARSFRQILLRVSTESADVLMGHLISG